VTTVTTATTATTATTERQRLVHALVTTATTAPCPTTPAACEKPYIREKITHVRTALGQRSITSIKALHRCTSGAPQQCNGERANSKGRKTAPPRQHRTVTAENEEMKPISPQDSTDRCTVALRGGRYPLPPLKPMQRWNTLEITDGRGSPCDDSAS